MPYTMEPLADPAMAVLGCQGTVAAYLVFHTAAVAGSFPFRVEVARPGGRVGWLYCPLEPWRVCSGLEHDPSLPNIV